LLPPDGGISIPEDLAQAEGSELYRASFMPLKMGIDTMQAVYGSFNFRFYMAAELRERSPDGNTTTVIRAGRQKEIIIV
jgi:hypothetical protein